MRLGPLVRRWLLPALLAVLALVSWQAANRADFDPGSIRTEAYEFDLQTPMLSARRLPKTLQAPVSDALIAPQVNVVVEQSPGEQVCLVVRNGDRILGERTEVSGGVVPASNQKLLTTYAALGLLDADFRFTTRAMAVAGPQGGVLTGDLYLVGGGDPFLITDDWQVQYEQTNGRFHTRLEDLADEVAAAGVTEITGSVVGDESHFDAERYGPWDPRLIAQQQSGPLSALTVNEGFVDWPDAASDTFRARSETNDPPLHAASVFAQLLQERGITIGAAPVASPAPAGAVEIGVIQSPPMSDIVTHINSYSSNLGAELVLKELGLAASGQGTTAAGAAAVMSYLESQNIPTNDLQIFDGSGLAETNRLTCAAVAAILVQTGPDSPFGQSLSISGQRGSLANRFVDTPANGLVLAKTGTLRGVRALSGYVQSTSPNDDEGFVTFAYIVNSEFVERDQIDPLQDTFMVALTQYPAGPSIDQLAPRPPTPAG